MTKLLDLAIEKIRRLPDVDQDATAEMLLWAIEAQSGFSGLDEETAAAIDEGLADARRGDFATDAEIANIWKPHGL